MPYVLVVDDERAIRHLLRRWLESWGYAVKQAGGANEALEIMSEEPASIMLCDVKMPEHDGLWLIEQVRARWPKTAVIMASSVDDLQTVTRSRRDGAVDYVMKPFGRELLLQALRRASEALDK